MVIKELFRNSKIEEKLTSFDLDQMIEEVSSRSFFFSEWMFAHIEGVSELDERHEQLGAIIDLIIYLTDQLDDIQDGDIKDEKGLIMNRAFMLLPLTLSLLDELSFPSLVVTKIKDICCQSLIESANGQALDLSNSVKDEADYHKMASQKSGALFNLAGSTGAIAAGIENEQVLDQIKLYSGYLGTIAQIYNDIDAIYEIDTHTDLQNKRMIFPVLYMMHDRDSLIGRYYSSKLTYRQLLSFKDEVISEFENKGAIPFCHFYIKKSEKNFIQAVKQTPVYSHNINHLVRYIERMS